MNKQNMTVLEYSPAQKTSWLQISAPKWTFWAAIILGILTYRYLLNDIERPGRERQKCRACAANLKQIGQAMNQYLEEQKTTPNQWPGLAAYANLKHEVFVCPDTTDTPARVVSEISQETGHCSYIYLAGGKDAQWMSDADRIIAYENHTHSIYGSNVLYADGRVGLLFPKEMNHFLSELAAGRNPPNPYPSTQPATTFSTPTAMSTGPKPIR